MEKLTQEIVVAQDCIDYCDEYMALQDVKFRKDFGPWKQGDEVPYLTFMWDEKKVVEQDEDGHDVPGGKSCNITLAAVVA